MKYDFLLIKEREKLIHTGFCFSQGEKHLTVSYPFAVLAQNSRNASLWIQCHLRMDSF